ncbi:alpha/beta fold hydrolase [Deinococcus yavapaiensis]|uniref:Proline iminopeptidase n=1 Tax=Deinococcus yavapaiensis KR-236 TaxID=694435 RepID=A0A318S6I0_9DEIO|nr:alpha/beta fold hydrolase [Deinococcus yavapaiensis]PYE50440.1 proline iminopeptidase [Deinococcus yavapaiensis KR-236]
MNFTDGEYTLTLGGVRQWVRVDGARHDTVPLVLVHGGPGGNHYVFERTAGPLLARERTVVYHEQRGCGRSDAPADVRAYDVDTLVRDLDALRSALGVPALDLLGYSFGGGLALAYAHAYPWHVRRVVAQAPALDLTDPRLVECQIAGFLEVAFGEVRALIEAILASHDPPEVRLERTWQAADLQTVDHFLFHDPAHARRNRAWWRESGLVNSGLMHRVVKARPVLPWQALAAVNVPTLVVVGRHDRNVGVAYARAVSDALPRGQFESLEDAAHFPDVETPETYVEVISRFLADER